MAMGIHKNDTIERVLQSHIRPRHRTDVLNQIKEVITNYAPKDSRMQRMSVYGSLKKTHSCQGSVQHNSSGFGMVQKGVRFAKATPKYSVLSSGLRLYSSLGQYSGHSARLNKR